MAGSECGAIMLLAGEASGDAHGATLCMALIDVLEVTRPS